MTGIRIGLVTVLCFLLMGPAIGPAAGQDALQIKKAPLKAVPVPAKEAPAKEPAAKKPAADKPAADKPNKTPEPAPKPPTGPRKGGEIFRLTLMDGTILNGQLAVSTFQVETEFGMLKIPMHQVSNFMPGMNSRPDFRKKFDTYVAQLGDDQFDNREKAEKALVEMGPSIRPALEKHMADKDEERRNRVEKILSQLEAMVGADEDDTNDTDRAMIAEDVISTPKFKVIGKLQIKSFSIKSKYGRLEIMLGDIRTAQRMSGDRLELRKTVTVKGSQITPNGFKASSIRVQRGDVIRVTASGSITLPPWGSRARSGPDGAQNYGWYINNKIPVGALVARLGGSGKVIKIGSKLTYTADRSGTLQFAIGMNPSYSNGNYNFGGEYKVKIVVQPK
jgi:hypothetical protein